ncbi:MAG: hypothetical protein OEY44_02500 [Candidatus Peregrinibacteria bacterium]|nr:hypothetical protein [Candidatus Peregrinibacteria bacterium]
MRRQEIMESIDRTAPDLNQQETEFLLKKESDILQELLQRKRTNPQDEVVLEVERLGNIGNLGASFDRIRDLIEGRPERIGQTNARFVVAFLSSQTIKGFLLEQCADQASDIGLTKIRDAFMAYLN